MARARRRIDPSLFPFISVMACIIGTLSLLISAAGLTSTFAKVSEMVRSDDPVLDDLAEAEGALATAQREQVQARVRLDEVRRDTERHGRGESERDLLDAMIRDARAKADSLRAEFERLGAAPSRKVDDDASKARDPEAEHRRAEEERRIRQDRELLQEMARGERARGDSLQNVYERLRREADRTESEAGQVRSDTVPIDPTWEGRQDVRPVFVECRPGEAVILATGARIKIDDMRDSPVLRKLFAGLRKEKGWCLFLLVRKGGVPAFNILYNRAVGEVALGFQPISADGALETSGWPVPPWL